MKIGIIGSRDFNDYSFLENSLNFFDRKNISLIVSGGARGADSLAERYAYEWSIQTKIFLADWNKYGNKAGYIRNEDIINNSDIIIAFWDGKSNGTRHSLGLAKKYKKPTFIFYF